MANINNPLIIQSDQTIFLEVHHKNYNDIRNQLSTFAELIKSPEHIHTYRINSISLWNAASSGKNSEDIIKCLKKYAKYEVPENVITNIKNTIGKFGQLKLLKTNSPKYLNLIFQNKELVEEIENHKQIAPLLGIKINAKTYQIDLLNRGAIKHKLIEIGYPVEDWAGFNEGNPYNFEFKKITLENSSFKMRSYQLEATDIFSQNAEQQRGHGVIVLPCGSGKTIIGIAIMHKLQTSTLILTTNIASCHQWIKEIIDKTTIPIHDIGEFTGIRKEIKPITVATYQILIHKQSKKNKDFPYFSIFQDHNWGLIIYDEVHLLPAPVFSITANIQSKRRLGLTATLIREDKRESEVFSLIGPKLYDVPWKELEKKGFIAKAICYEIRIPLTKENKLNYMAASKRAKFKIASTNKNKLIVIKKLLNNHNKEQFLIIGQYLDQLKSISESFNIPLITGKINHQIREELYESFRNKNIQSLVVSKVANFAIDLPEASVAIQVSGSYGSRQEEAQRLGRILRPKKQKASFYSLITKNSIEEDFNHKRQLFLTEQGYEYIIRDYTFT